MNRSFDLRDNVPLAPLTTLQVGGAARYLATCETVSQLHQAVEWAADEQMKLFVLGGGSNLLVSDDGFDGLVVRFVGATLETATEGSQSRLRVAAGMDWDALVGRAVECGIAGLECLSGIPGCVGAAPIQNIGAYGQEVAETLEAVQVLDVATGQVSWLAASDCGLGYRHSDFKGAWRGRYVVTGIELVLERRDEGTLRYGELQRRFAAGNETPTLRAVRRAVLEIRAAKSMVLSDDDPNRRSAGSFFVNPVVSAEQAKDVEARWRHAVGLQTAADPAAVDHGADSLPAYPTADGGVKLSAAWLIERAGFPKGYVLGPAGLSTRHTLALINRGAANAHDLIALAAKIRRGVHRAFGVTLVPEPTFLGFEQSVDKLLGCPS